MRRGAGKRTWARAGWPRDGLCSPRRAHRGASPLRLRPLRGQPRRGAPVAGPRPAAAGPLRLRPSRIPPCRSPPFLRAAFFVILVLPRLSHFRKRDRALLRFLFAIARSRYSSNSAMTSAFVAAPNLAYRWRTCVLTVFCERNSCCSISARLLRCAMSAMISASRAVRP